MSSGMLARQYWSRPAVLCNAIVFGFALTVTLPSCRLNLSEDLLWFDFAFKHIAKLQLLSLCVVSLGVKASNGFADRHRQTPPCELEQFQVEQARAHESI
jgi:hypothetical protein